MFCITQYTKSIKNINMSLGYFLRYRFNSLTNPGEDDTKISDLNAESGNLLTESDNTYGTVLRLDGSTSLVSENNVSLISGNRDRSLSFWAKTDNSVGDYAPVFSYGDNSASFIFYARNTGMLSEFYDSVNRIPGNSVISGSWHFFAITYSSVDGSLKIYVDGLLDTISSLSLDTSDSQLRIGTDGLGEYFEGNILDLRLFNSFLRSDAIGFMLDSGPNFEQSLETNYAESGSSRGNLMAKSVVCRSTYGVSTHGVSQNPSQKMSFFGTNQDSEIIESARVEHSQDSDGIGTVTTRIRHTNSSNLVNMMKTMEFSPGASTFTSTDASSNSNSVIFSSKGVSVMTGSGTEGGLYFGAGKDFRIAIVDGIFAVQAYSSQTGDFVTKMEIGS